MAESSSVYLAIYSSSSSIYQKEAESTLQRALCMVMELMSYDYHTVCMLRDCSDLADTRRAVTIQFSGLKTSV